MSDEEVKNAITNKIQEARVIYLELLEGKKVDEEIKEYQANQTSQERIQPSNN